MIQINNSINNGIQIQTTSQTPNQQPIKQEFIPHSQPPGAVGNAANTNSPGILVQKVIKVCRIFRLKDKSNLHLSKILKNIVLKLCMPALALKAAKQTLFKIMEEKQRPWVGSNHQPFG